MYFELKPQLFCRANGEFCQILPKLFAFMLELVAKSA